MEPRELTGEEEVISVRRYLRSVGDIPAVIVAGGYDALVRYLQGRLH